MGTAQVLFVVVLPEMASPEMASPQDTSPKVTGTGSREPETGNEREIISRVFVPVFPGFFPGTPLDSRYEQWNCDSNQS